MISEQLIIKPEDIEKESFRIIGEELKEMGIKLSIEKESIIKRVIHTTADFSYVDSLAFSDNAVDIARQLMREGANIITDTNMALAGINKKRLETYGVNISCFMSDSDVAAKAKKLGTTRATVSMQKAYELNGKHIFVIGNAPTALIELHRLIAEEGKRPDFVIGVPVGFVNVEYSKELFRDGDIPYIINFGRKGGSNVAAAIVNALSLGL